MNPPKKNILFYKLLLTIGSACGVFLSLFLMKTEQFGFCSIKTDPLLGAYWKCFIGNHGDLYSLGETLFVLSITLLFVSFLVTFVSHVVFNSWLRFAAWWIPLSIILIVITPETGNSWMPLYFIGKGTVTVLMASLFTIISLILIAWKTFAVRKTS